MGVWCVCGCMVCVCGCMVCGVGVWCVCVVWAYLEREQDDIDDKSEHKLAAVETVIVAS